MQGLVLLLIVGITVWNGVTRIYNPVEEASASLEILRGTLLYPQSSGGLRASITFAEKAAFLWRGRVGTAWPMFVAAVRLQRGRMEVPRRWNLDLKKEGVGTLRALAALTLSHGKISVGGHHLGPGRPERGSCLLGERSDASYC